MIGYNRAYQNYYHWMTQCLPAIALSVRHLGSGNCVLALPPLSAWQEQSLTLLGLTDTPRIAINLSHHYYFHKAHFCEYLNGSAAFFLSPRLLQILNSTEAISISRRSPRASWSTLPGRTSTNRALKNEAEVEALLQSFGFASVAPGNLSVEEQIRLFRGARVIVGAHGAGLTNVVFCRPATKVLELVSSNYKNPCFNRLSQAGRLDYHVECFESAACTNAHDQPWDVDINRLAARIAAILSE